ncbi:hypothetical protein [Paenibacillus sinensis]|uniref:hypothetical protein n=1 Tax=Paenibacillus sinensis TaxID=2834413 RepID=UPI001CA95CB9|nr:hypothetical protein [Paenibacillus sinensis]
MDFNEEGSVYLLMENLSELKDQVIAYCEKRKQHGGTVAYYKCPSCYSKLVNVTPDKKGERWDSTTKCYECGKLHFTVKTKGKITATSL